ncbi:protein rolling stone isoform X2 [Culicoides brevitarsis]|uniref:protein rolling stone isoform X2 n=1 Tax=Culicoides brevitarsis TaxID=469753 RepID=UPI00307B3C62
MARHAENNTSRPVETNMVNKLWNTCKSDDPNVQTADIVLSRVKTHKHHFYLCQWQTNTQVSLFYLLYRWLVAISFLAIVVCTVLDIGRTEPITEHHYAKWCIYLTNWGILACAIQAWLAAFIVTGGIMIVEEEFELDNPTRKNIIHKTYWFFYTIATIYSLIITVMYWTVIYDPEIHKINAVNMMSHVVNSVLMLIDLIVVGHPIKIQHAYQTIGLGIIYMIFTITYYILDGTNRLDEPFVYKPMDWSRPGKALAISVGGLIFVFIVHFICYLVYRVRVCIYNACCRKDNERDKFTALGRTLSTNLDTSQRQNFLNPTTIIDLKV